MASPEQLAGAPAAPPLRKFVWPTISTEWLSRQFEYTPRRWPRDVRLEAVWKHVHADVGSLRERARVRRYQDTLPVLSFYWLRTVRESR